MLNIMTTKEQNIDRLVIITAITFVVSMMTMIALPIVLSDFHINCNMNVVFTLAAIAAISFISTIVITVIDDNN
jgi:hypothetical protein